MDRNPFLWLNNRGSAWETSSVWFWLLFPALGWAWMTWAIWTWRTLNVAVVFAIAVGLSWALVLLATIPAHACQQLVTDRASGALELLLSTPATVESIARGIWQSVGRRFLLPLSAALLLSAGLMISGYLTSGFGGCWTPRIGHVGYTPGRQGFSQIRSEATWHSFSLARLGLPMHSNFHFRCISRGFTLRSSPRLQNNWERLDKPESINQS